ncbi:alpha/beta fold hydrolase [Novosphingobium sp.]|uniref:alpha/beta fold hydrolase n=1 Tax=Novosphingobium sp. TaxID=1874826 RepID=UPI0038B89F3C
MNQSETLAPETLAPEILTLKHGQLRFTARAMGSGPVVLCLHGFPDTLCTFDGLLPALAASGFRGVAVAMRGYEPQSQPANEDYHAVRMAEDVAAWIDQLGDGPVHLVGHDWGATIAFAAAALVPDQIASLVALAVPHPLRFAEVYAASPEQQRRSHYIQTFQAGEADARLLADDCAELVALWRAWSPGWAIPTDDLAEVRAAIARPGVVHAILEWYRQAFDFTSHESLATQALLAGPFRAPTLGLVGEDDGCIAADVFEAAMQPRDFPGGLAVHRVAGAGHFLHREQHGRVIPLMLDWLARHR